MKQELAHRRSSRRRRVRLDRRTWVSIRPIDAFDVSALSDFYARLSDESMRRRFLGGCHLTEDDIVRMAAGPGLVAVLHADGPDDGAIVAHGQLCPDGTGRAEGAFAVRDDLQGHGIGRAMASSVVELARSLGLRTLVADTYPDNRAMRRLLLGTGCPIVRDRIEAGVEELEIDLVSGASPAVARVR